MKTIKLHFKNAGGDTFHSTDVRDDIAEDLLATWMRNAERMVRSGEIKSYEISITNRKDEV